VEVLECVKHIKEKLYIFPQMSLVKVWTDTGKGKPVSLLAKIVESDPPNITIRYLSKTEEEYKGCSIWRYEDETYVIDDDSITEWLETDDELEAGFKTIPDDPEGFIFYESDSDYVPSDDDDEDDDDEDGSEEAEDFSEDFDDEGSDDEDCAWE
jgi:hypothetical protein